MLTVSASSETIEILKKNEEMLKKPIQAEKIEYVEVAASSSTDGSAAIGAENAEPVLEVTKI